MAYQEIGPNLTPQELQKINANFQLAQNSLEAISGDVLNEVITQAQLIWKEPVTNFAALSANYPEPETGWTSMTRDNGKVYRYNGTSWVEIQQIDAGPVNELDTRLTADLAETSERLQSLENYDGGIFSIIDDDGMTAFLTRWKPIADAQGIKISLAVHSDAVGVSTFLTLPQLQQLKSEGYDILSHGRNAINLNTASLAEIETSWQVSKDYLIANGLGDDLAMVYPGGLFNVTDQNKVKAIKAITRKHYRYGIDALASTSAINSLPVDSYEVLRRNFNPLTDTLATVKDNIDDAYNNKKWFILLTHVGNSAQWDDTISTNSLNGIIDYVQSLGMPILTFAEAEKLVGNAISHGDSRTDNYNFVARNGATWSNGGKITPEVTPMSVSSMDALITEYPKYVTTSMQIGNLQDTFLNTGGRMDVYRGDTNFSYALFYPALTNKIYKRVYRDTTSSWGDWTLVSANETLVAKYTHTTNKEVAISSVDISTDTFTSNAHGLVNGEKIFPVMNNNAGSIYPQDKYVGGISFSAGYFVVNATTNTFQLSLTSGGSPIDLSANANMDLTKWHFETSVDGFNILSLPANAKYRLKVKGKSLYKSSAMFFKPNGIGSAAEWMVTGGTTFTSLLTSVFADIDIDLDITFDYTKYLTMKMKGYTLASNTPTANVMTLVDKTYVSPKYNASTITNFQMTSWYPANGTTIEVYALN